MDWWDEPVEGEKEDFDERVNKAGNQPIPQPSELETTIPKGAELPLEQPGEQGTLGKNKAASGEGTDDEWAATATRDATEDRESSYEMAKGEVEWQKEGADAGVILRALYLKTEPRWEYYSDLAWNPWVEEEGMWQEGSQITAAPNGRSVSGIEGKRSEKEKGTVRLAWKLTAISQIALPPHPYNPSTSRFEAKGRHGVKSQGMG